MKETVVGSVPKSSLFKRHWFLCYRFKNPISEKNHYLNISMVPQT